MQHRIHYGIRWSQIEDADKNASVHYSNIPLRARPAKKFAVSAARNVRLSSLELLLNGKPDSTQHWRGFNHT